MIFDRAGAFGLPPTGGSMRRYLGAVLALLLCLLPVWASAQSDYYSGSITTNGNCVQAQTVKTSNATIEVSGTWTGTLTFSGTINGSTWFNVLVTPIGGGDAVNTTTSNGRWAFGLALRALRACATASMTGTAAVAFLVSTASGPMFPGTATAGAPADATFVTISASASLSDERVLTGTSNQITITDAGAGSTVTLSLPTTVNLGVASTTAGKVLLYGSTSGNTTVQATAIAGTTTVTLPAATDTLVGKATTDTFTNKTYDTAGSGNVFSINGTAVSAVTGTGAVVLANTPTLITPVLGVATGTSFQGIIGNVTPAAGTFTTATANTSVTTPLAIVTAGANTVPVAVSGYSVTGSGTSGLSTLAGTLNTSGVVDVVKLSITDTAHGSGTKLLHLYGGAGGVTDLFAVDTAGVISSAGVAGITTTVVVACGAAGAGVQTFTFTGGLVTSKGTCSI